MPLADILKAQSTWTWNIMLWSSRLGEMIREDAITSVNLATIAEQARQAALDVYIMSHQGAHMEWDSGADWQWASNGSFWLVQAKRLDVVPGSRAASTYQIDLVQLDKLVSTAKAMSTSSAQYGSAYVFYNSMTEAFPYGPEGAGCTFIDATKLLGYISSLGLRPGQATVALSVKQTLDAGALPWYMMFPS